MLPPLPTEIWLQIASYIPEREMHKLYHMSRAFYELGVDAIYRELRVSSFTKGMVSRIQSASKPSLSRRVLALDIHLHAFDALGASRVRSPLGFFASLLHRNQEAHITRMSSPEVSSIVLKSVKQMTSLRRCRLHMTSNHLETYLPFLREFWDTVHSRVHDLTLEVPGNGLRLVLPIFAELSPLDSLSLILCDDNTDGWGSSTAQDAVNFFNRTARSLESLSLTSCPATPVHHLRLIFTRLYQFPMLKKVYLNIQFDDITGYNVAQFLNVHSQSIRDLTLIPRVSANSAATPLATLRLPALQKLEMSFKLAAPQFNRFWAAGLLTFTNLTHLRINSPFLAHDRFSLICDAFGRSQNGHQVHTVHFDLQELNGMVFGRLLSSFPILHTLSIRASFLSVANESGTWDVVCFAEDMEDRSYPEWSLHDITFSHPDQDYPEDPTYASYEAMRTAAKSIPSVQSFCGWGNMDEPCNLRLERKAGKP